jgi:hypothetical protein
MNDTIRMQISAFVDGELPDSEADLLVRRIGQDAELRRAAAEFLELGRVVRGEPSVPGIERLRERIAAAIDDKAVEEDDAADATLPARSLRPLVGFAVAASVALVALVALQFSAGVATPDAVDASIADISEEPGITVPQPDDAQLRQYLLNHGASSSEQGANGMNTRLVTLRLSEEVQEEPEEEAATDEDGAVEAPLEP